MFKVLCVGGPLDGIIVEKREPKIDGYTVHSFSGRDSDDVRWVAGFGEVTALELLDDVLDGYYRMTKVFNDMKEY